MHLLVKYNTYYKARMLEFKETARGNKYTQPCLVDILVADNSGKFHED